MQEHSSETDLTRREFVAATLTAGFALATNPVSAQTITTDTACKITNYE